MATPDYELFAIRHATRDAQRSEHFIGGDPADADGLFHVAGAGRRALLRYRHRLQRGNRPAAQADFPALPVETLCAFDIDPADVKDVILTHLLLRPCREFRPLSERAVSSPGARTRLRHPPLHATPRAVAFLGGR
ncbi:hypothetical protein P0R31_19225 [Bradyrhizobium yuanmingense]|uniref:hypothetical protein n=1 Tax=Bradyrhizobium yuanmingense TaxID=108015 RepID=UPI0023B912C3|nr:hypothetical protein [Bradyrhizobium yuanmingense]MDF0519372.1 hypothetical protein [Bradyrhizobium yuanmingense]